MSRTVAALYDSRHEADLARAHLASEVQARSLRIIGKDTLGALEGLDIAAADKEAYRDAIRNGGYLLVAEAPSGADGQLIIDLLEEAMGRVDEGSDQFGSDGGPGIRVESPAEEAQDRREASQSARLRAAPAAMQSDEGVPASKSPRPWFEQRLRRGVDDLDTGGARVRAVTRDEPAEEVVMLAEESISIEHRTSDQPMSQSEVEAA